MKYIILSICITFFAGCVTHPPLTNENVASVLLGTEYNKYDGLTGITQNFDQSGAIYALVSLVWEDATKNDYGKHKIISKWYNEDKLVSQREVNGRFKRQPVYAHFSILGSAMRPGKGRFEAWSGEILLGSAEFIVSEVSLETENLESPDEPSN